MTLTTTMSIFFKMAAAAGSYFFNGFIPKVSREQPYQIWMQSNQRFISYRAHKLFRRPSWKMAAYGLGPKKLYGMNCPGT